MLPSFLLRESSAVHRTWEAPTWEAPYGRGGVKMAVLPRVHPRGQAIARQGSALVNGLRIGGTLRVCVPGILVTIDLQRHDRRAGVHALVSSTASRPLDLVQRAKVTLAHQASLHERPLQMILYRLCDVCPSRLLPAQLQPCTRDANGSKGAPSCSMQAVMCGTTAARPRHLLQPLERASKF